MPKGLKMKKFFEGPEGTLIHDTSYVGEDAWDDDDDNDGATTSKDKVKEIINRDVRLNTEAKKELQEELGLSDINQQSRGTWKERMQIWKEILRNERLAEQLDSSCFKYAIEFDMKEVEKSFREDAKVSVKAPQGLEHFGYQKDGGVTDLNFLTPIFLKSLNPPIEVAAVVFTAVVYFCRLICRHLIHTCLK